jgi:hypothetical protein
MDNFKTHQICLNDWHWVGSLLLTCQDNFIDTWRWDWHVVLKWQQQTTNHCYATNPQEQRLQLHHSRSLKFHTSKWCLQTLMILKPKCFKFINTKINSVTFSFATECSWAQQLDCLCHVRLRGTLHRPTTLFTHFIWMRSLRFTKTETDFRFPTSIIIISHFY